MKKEKLVILVLSVFLVLAVVVIGYFVFGNMINNLQTNAYQQGYGVGYEQAFMGIVSQAEKCELVPISVNDTVVMNLLAYECLNTTEEPIVNESE